MTKSEFIQQACLGAFKQGFKDPWGEAQNLANAAPAGTFDAQARSAPASGGGAGTFPNFGKSKNAPISGASQNDLRYYAGAAIRSIEDASKARFLDSNRAQLASYVAEMERQGFDASEFKQAPAQDRGIEHERRPLPGDPAPSDDDIPF